MPTADKQPSKSLSKKEEEIMSLIWEHGPLFVREVVELMPEPRPHVNTVATFMRSMEAKGWLSREQMGNSYRYAPAVPVAEFRERSVRGFIDRFFGRSYMSLVSALVKEEKISTDELKELIRMIEEGREQ